MLMPATVMRCCTADTARKRTAGAGSHSVTHRADVTWEWMRGWRHELGGEWGGCSDRRQQRTGEERKGQGEMRMGEGGEEGGIDTY